MKQVDSVGRAFRSSYPRIPFWWVVGRVCVSLKHDELVNALGLRARARQGRIRTLIELAKARLTARNSYTNLIFNAPFYRAAYHDVADSGALAWQHFLAFGKAEGRSPHPLIDVVWLAVQLDVDQAEAIDRYFCDPTLKTNPSPYLDVRGFAEREQRNRAHPFFSIQQNHATYRWLSGRLQLIDALSASDDERERIAGVMSPLPEFADNFTQRELLPLGAEGATRCEVAPGVAYFSSTQAAELGDWATTTDHRVFRHGRQAYVVGGGIAEPFDQLVVMPDGLITAQRLRHELAGAGQLALVARTYGQFEALSLLDLGVGVRVLDWRVLKAVDVASEVRQLSPELDLPQFAAGPLRVYVLPGQDMNMIEEASKCILDASRSEGYPGVRVPALIRVPAVDLDYWLLAHAEQQQFIAVST